MDRANPSVVVLLIAFVVVVGSNTGDSERNSTTIKVAPTTKQTSDAVSSQLHANCLRSSMCCRLGRKAVRLSYPVMYTCKIEALAQGLEYHTSASHRLRLTPPRRGQSDRMDAANSLHISFGFRKRLMLCQVKGQEQKQCFQTCCETKLKENEARAKRISKRKAWDEKGNEARVSSSFWRELPLQNAIYYINCSCE